MYMCTYLISEVRQGLARCCDAGAWRLSENDGEYAGRCQERDEAGQSGDHP